MNIKKCLLQPGLLFTLYIVSIILFALLYNTFFSNQFYHSTLKYESQYQELKDTILEDLDSSIIRNFRSWHRDSTMIKIEKEWFPAYLHIDKIHLENLQVKDDEITFSGYFYSSDIWHMPPGKGRPTNYNYKFTLHSNSQTVKKPSFYGETRELWAYSYPDNPIDAKYLIPKKDSLSPPSIFLSDHQIENINTIIGYNNGIVKRNSFVRMLYFSTVTISTIGYGDIAPINDGLRMLVGLEAIIGVVFIGLFINAVGEWLKK